MALDIFKCCKGCPDRKIVDGVRCHSWCEKYKADQELNKKRLAERIHEQDTKDYRHVNRVKIAKRRNTRGKV